MNRKIILSTVIILILLIGLVAFISFSGLSGTSKEQKPFYVGVTFGGNTFAEAKQLIDKVKDYTNLFVVTSGSMQKNITELETTCDYAVKSGLDVIVYFSPYETQRNTTAGFIDAALERWNSHFLGVYNGDEPGGKMLDSDVYLGDVPNLGNVSKGQYSITISQINGSIRIFKEFSFSGEIYISYSDLVTRNSTTYFPNGKISVLNNTELENPEILNYLPNGTVTLQKGWLDSPVIVTDRGSISQFEPYQELWNSRPLRTSNDQATVATTYVNTKQAQTGWVHNQADIDVFTSDYALYWWDYLGGYDTIFTQLGWNNTVAQEIGLVRGAANLQEKSWGTIITWKYTQAPYLASGDEMFDQMKASYEAGAEYVVVFNYAEDMKSPYGTLQEEHFRALEGFWNDVVQNPDVVHGGVKAEAALVLPKDFGWGMRSQHDTIWGLWRADSTDTTEQVWTQLQSLLSQYGSKLDIVYDDPAYPVTGKYGEVFYWNQTG